MQNPTIDKLLATMDKVVADKAGEVNSRLMLFRAALLALSLSKLKAWLEAGMIDQNAYDYAVACADKINSSPIYLKDVPLEDAAY